VYQENTGEHAMPAKPRPSKTMCYIHEMRHPLELPYELHKYHICWTCQSRLLEIARVNFRFTLGDQTVTVSATPRAAKEAA
jgi:hypothetical protein